MGCYFYAQGNLFISRNRISLRGEYNIVDCGPPHDF